MAVKLELYRVFHEVARMGNISAAAQNLFISQSAVSQSIKQLEEQLQVRLFSRSTKGVYLTSEGKLLQEYISHALGLIQSGEEKLAQSRQLLTGELIIGASDTVTKTYLLSRLEAFHRDYPDIRIRILNGTSHMVLNYLHAGQVDIAFASDDQDPAVYDVRHCDSDGRFVRNSRNVFRRKNPGGGHSAAAAQPAPGAGNFGLLRSHPDFGTDRRETEYGGAAGFGRIAAGGRRGLRRTADPIGQTGCSPGPGSAEVSENHQPRGIAAAQPPEPQFLL